jgi:hypothetical protein
MFCLVISLPTAETWSAEVVRPVRERMEREGAAAQRKWGPSEGPIVLERRNQGSLKDLYQDHAGW